MTDNNTSNNKKYHAFISYRHADNKEQGRQWATWLHQSIETYEVPAELVGKVNGRGEIIPANIYPVFRDEVELPANADLGNSIIGALNCTQLLIVLCSPRAFASTYVADEIDYFKKLGHSNQIIAAIIDGEPNTSWDKGKQSEGFSEKDECFPIPLQLEYDENGKPTNKHAEPIAADFRINDNGMSEQGWTSIEAYRLALKESSRLDNKTIQERVNNYQKQQHLMLLKIVAGVIGVPLGDLAQRDKEHQLEIERKKAKKLRKWLASVLILAVVAIVAGILAYIKEQKATENELIAHQQKNRALISQSSSLMNLAQNENEKGNYDKALLIGLNAIPGSRGGIRPISPNLDALKIAVNKNRKVAEFIHNGFVDYSIISADGKVLAIQLGNAVELWSLETLEKLHTLSHDFNVSKIVFTPDSKQILSIANNILVMWDLKDAKKIILYEHSLPFTDVLIDPKSKYIVTLSTPDYLKPSTVTLWEYGKNEPLAIIDSKRHVESAQITPSGQNLVLQFYDSVALYAIKSNLRTVHHRKGIYQNVSNKDQAIFYFDNKVDVVSTTGKELYHQIVLDSDVKSVEVNASGTKILISEIDNTVTLWSIENKNIDKVYVNQNAVFSAEGTGILLYKKGENTLEYHSISDLNESINISTKQPILSVLYSENSKQVYLYFEEHVELWDLVNNKILQVFYFGLAQSKVKIVEGQRLLIATQKSLDNNFYDDKTMVWTLNNPHYEKIFDHEDIKGIEFISECKQLISFSENTVKVWSIESAKLLNEYVFEKDILAIESSRKNCFVIINFFESNAKILSTRTGEIKGLEHSDRVNVSFDGQFVYLWQSSGKELIILSGPEWKEKSVIKFDDALQSIVVSPVDNIIAATMSDKTQIISMPLKKIMQTINHGRSNYPYNFSPDGQIFVTANSKHSAHGSVSLWATKTGRLLTKFDEDSPIYTVDFNENTDLFATTTQDGRVSIWSIPNKSLVRSFSLDGAGYYPDFVLNDSTLVITYAPSSIEGGIRSQGGVVWDSFYDAVLFDIKTGEKRQTIRGTKNLFKPIFIQHRDVIISPIDTNRFALIRANALSLHDEALSTLPKFRECLTPSERYELGLEPFNYEKLNNIGCPQFAEFRGATRRLFKSIGQNNMDEVMMAIKDGADIQSKNKYDFHPLTAAIYFWRPQAALALIKSGANPNIEYNGFSPLMIAPEVGKDDIGIAQHLIDAGAKVNAVTSNNTTALHIALRRETFSYAEILLQNGALVDIKDNNGVTPLDIAIEKRYALGYKYLNKIVQSYPDLKLEKVRIGEYVKLIINYRYNRTEAEVTLDSKLITLLLSIDESIINQVDNNGKSILMNAIKNNKVGIAMALLSSGSIQIEPKNKDGVSAVFMATNRLQLPVVERLLNLNVDVTSVDKDGKNLFHQAIMGTLLNEKSNEIAQNTRLEIIRLLIKANVNIEHLSNEDQISPLVWAVMFEQYETIKLFLANKVNADFVNINGLTALGMAKHMKSIGTINMDPIISILEKQSIINSKVKNKKI